MQRSAPPLSSICIVPCSGCSKADFRECGEDAAEQRGQFHTQITVSQQSDACGMKFRQCLKQPDGRCHRTSFSDLPTTRSAQSPRRALPTGVPQCISVPCTLALVKEIRSANRSSSTDTAAKRRRFCDAFQSNVAACLPSNALLLFRLTTSLPLTTFQTRHWLS